MGGIRIAQAQINTTVGDFQGNAAKICVFIERARKEGADIVTFPELALSGYPPEDLLLKPNFLQDSRRTLETVIKEGKGITAVVGFPHAVDGNVYNAAALIYDSKLVETYHQGKLPDGAVLDEKRYFVPGSEYLLFEMDQIPVMITISEDLWNAGGEVEQNAVKERVEIILNLSASPFHPGKLSERNSILGGFARRTGATVCYNNLVGGQDELVFDGGSLVLNPEGKVLASACRFEEDLLFIDI